MIYVDVSTLSYCDGELRVRLIGGGLDDVNYCLGPQMLVVFVPENEIE